MAHPRAGPCQQRPGAGDPLSRRAIVVVEGSRSRSVGLVAMPLQLPLILLLTPFVRPFRWSRLLLTYVVPLIPLLVVFDGTSFLLVAGVPGHESFAWDIGSTKVRGFPHRLSHLIGTPKR